MSDQSERRVFVDKQRPSIYKAMSAAAAECRSQAVEVGLTRATLELVNVRASQINGCAFCLDLHTRLAVKEGVTAQQLGVLPAWRETEVFSDIDRAALEIAEAVSNVATEHFDDPDYARVRGQLTDDQLAVLVYAASLINAFNRLSILSQHPVTHREARD